MNSLLCISSYTWIGRHLKETVILGNITWPEMGKHDVELGGLPMRNGARDEGNGQR